MAEYVQRVKIEAPKLQLKSSPATVSEIMAAVGYADAQAFRTLFKRLTGTSPLPYRARYCR